MLENSWVFDCPDNNYCFTNKIARVALCRGFNYRYMDNTEKKSGNRLGGKQRATDWKWLDDETERYAEDALKDDWEHPDNDWWDEYYDNPNQTYIKVTLEKIVKRLDRIDNRVDTLHSAQISLIRWMIGVGLTVVGLTVTLVKLL